MTAQLLRGASSRLIAWSSPFTICGSLLVVSGVWPSGGGYIGGVGLGFSLAALWLSHLAVVEADRIYEEFRRGQDKADP